MKWSAAAPRVCSDSFHNSRTIGNEEWAPSSAWTTWTRANLTFREPGSSEACAVWSSRSWPPPGKRELISPAWPSSKAISLNFLSLASSEGSISQGRSFARLATATCELTTRHRTSAVLREGVPAGWCSGPSSNTTCAATSRRWWSRRVRTGVAMVCAW